MTRAADPAVYSIAPGRAFLDALAAGILTRHGRDPLQLSQVTVLLPTRRACRNLNEAFLRLGGGAALLLPVIRPLGDIDEDELDLRGGSEPEALPFTALDRNLLLANLVRRASALAGDDPATALRLARELGHLLDAAATEEIGLDKLPTLVPAELSQHWQQTLDFLDVIRRHWPAIKIEQGRLDAAEHRQRVTQRWIEHWRDHPPAGPVIAAGSTGTIPATARLLQLIARLPQGCVVLPGLDRGLDDAAWAAAHDEPTHPQHALARLLDVLGVLRNEVQDWPAGGGDDVATARANLFSAALLPPGETHRWGGMGAALPDAAFTGLQRVDAPGPREEALSIALLMRETLEQPGRTAALITPDRMLARRVAAELARYGISVDDSAGMPLDQTPPAVFLRLLADAVAADCAPVPLLALLKHPFCRLGMARLDLLRWCRRLERAVLREPRPQAGLRRLADDLKEHHADLLPPLGRLAAILQPLHDLQLRDTVALEDLLRTLVVAAEALTAPAEDDDAPSLWEHDSGEALHGLVTELLQASHQFGSLPPVAWPRLLEALLEGQVVRPKRHAHPRLFIWGLLEARLQQADRIILGGLNEGTWPPQAKEDPWLSRPMRKALGLSPPEFRLGQTAHDFMQAACGDDVILTRATKVDGTPTVPARWLLRLEALLGTDARWAATQSVQPLHWATQMDRPAETIRSTPPRPVPPVEARPRGLYVTDIETWVRDPYAIYAKRILNLRALDEPDQPPDARLRGTVIHKVLETFLKKYPSTLPDDDAALAELCMLGRQTFGAWLLRPEIEALWWPRFERAMAWFLGYERARRRDGFQPVLLEQAGALEIAAPAGTFTLQAKADRIDRNADGTLAVLDYKTGRPPSAKQVHAGLSPQLALEAAIAAGGGFRNLTPGEIAELVYIRLSGSGAEPGEAKRIEGTSRTKIPPADELAKEAYTRLVAWVARFDDADMPYLSRPRPQFVDYAGDYDHLARVAERTEGTGENT